MKSYCGSPLPLSGVDIHPFMPRNLHDNGRSEKTPGKDRTDWSPLGRRCLARDISIHNRPAVEKVYDQMRQEELLPRK